MQDDWHETGSRYVVMSGMDWDWERWFLDWLDVTSGAPRSCTKKITLVFSFLKDQALEHNYFFQISYHLHQWHGNPCWWWSAPFPAVRTLYSSFDHQPRSLRWSPVYGRGTQWADDSKCADLVSRPGDSLVGYSSGHGSVSVSWKGWNSPGKVGWHVHLQLAPCFVS